MTGFLEMTVLVDNVAEAPLESEWGLSVLIRADDRRILLDTGASGLFVRNAERLGIDLADIDVGVLSHAHYDHADGLDAFFALNRMAPFLLRAGCGEDCYGVNEAEGLHYIGIRKGALRAHADRIRYVRGVHEVAEGIWLVPHRPADYSRIARRNDLYVMRDGARRPDDFAHEQSLVFDTPRGLVVFNSCSHTGMANLLADLRRQLGREDVFAYVGGLHLYLYTDDELRALCEEIRANAIAQIFTGHCTGERALGVLRTALGDRIRPFSSGFTHRFV